MKVKELKAILQKVPDNADILIAVADEDYFTDTQTHGRARAYHMTIEGDDVFVFSPIDCGFDPMELNYNDLHIVKKFR